MLTVFSFPYRPTFSAPVVIAWPGGSLYNDFRLWVRVAEKLNNRSGGWAMLSVGERVRKRRQDLGWSQDQLAHKAGISKGFLSDLETGKRRLGADTLLDLGRALAVSLDFLMTGDEGQPPDLQIPGDLAAFASEEGLSMRQTLTLLQMQRLIVLNRKEPVRKRQEQPVDWRGFYLAVKRFL